MTSYLGIDPGPELQAWVLLDCIAPIAHGESKLGVMPSVLGAATHVCIEDFVTYRRTTADSRETIKAIGAMRWIAFHMFDRNKASVIEIPRVTILAHFGCTGKGGDANLRAALTDRFGGSKQAAWGTKKNPGPLYGLTGSHKLAALAAALYMKETCNVDQGH